MNAISDADLKAALDDAYAEAKEREPYTGIHYVAESLRRRAKDKDDPLAALLWGLDYHFIAYQEQRDNGPFGPLMEGGGRRYPAPIEVLGDEVYHLWARAAALSPAAIIAARYYDLLWEARYGPKRIEWAWQAIDAYAEGMADGWGVDRSDAARRAYELAWSIADSERRAMGVERILDLIRESLNDGATPGIDLPLLDLLVAEPEIESGVLMEIVDQAIATYAGDPWHLDSALGIKARLSDPAEVEGLRRRQVEAFADLAHRSEGIARFAHLRRAVEMAEEFRLSDLAEALRAEAESMTDDEIGLHKVAAEVTIPQEAIDRWIQEIVGDDRAEDALLRFGSHIPSGNPEQTRRFVNELAGEAPLLSIIPKMTIGPEGALLRTVQGDDQEAQAVIEHEAFLVSFFGLIAVQMIEAIRERYGALSSVAESVFHTPLIDEQTARTLARCVELYEEGRYDECAHVMVPRIERILRGLARSIGFSVTKSPSHNLPGGVLGLGTILGKLQAVVVEPSWRYLTVLLTRETGVNLRNRISHGLIDEVRREEAVLLIHVCFHLAGFRIEIKPDIAEGDQETD